MGAITELESGQLLLARGIPVVQTLFASTVEDACVVAERLGYPVVLKVVSPQVLHKTDAGGVKVGIPDDSGLRKAWREIEEAVISRVPHAEIQGMLVQRMAGKGVEVILGGVRDPFFGPVIMFGLGGIFAEVFNDVAFRLAPISVAEAERMMRETRGYRVLTGARNRPPCDVRALALTLSRVSELMWEDERIVELDINPVVVYEEGRGCEALDALVVMK